MSLLDPVAPYQKPKNINKKWASIADDKYEPGVRPGGGGGGGGPAAVALDQFTITPIMRRVLNKGEEY